MKPEQPMGTPSSAGHPDIAILGLTQTKRTSGYGGAPVVVVNLANALAERGFRVLLFVFASRSSDALPFAIAPSVQIELVCGRSRLLLMLRLWAALLRLRPGVLLAASNRANRLGAMLKRVPGLRFRFWPMLQHSLTAEIGGWSRARQARRLRRWRGILRRSEGAIAVSRGVADELIGLTGVGADRVQVIYNPVVTDEFNKLAAAPSQHPWFQDTGPGVVLGVGRLTAQKDFATLIRAFATLRRQRPCRLMILGEGPQRASLRELCARLGVDAEVAMPGFVENPLPYMRDARLLVMSSTWEGFGNVLVEAMFCGTPVVSTDCPQGPREVLDEGRFGRLVPVADADAMARAMLETWDDPADRAALQRRAALFSADGACDRYQAILGLGSPSRGHPSEDLPADSLEDSPGPGSMDDQGTVL